MSVGGAPPDVCLGAFRGGLDVVRILGGCRRGVSFCNEQVAAVKVQHWVSGRQDFGALQRLPGFVVPVELVQRDSQSSEVFPSVWLNDGGACEVDRRPRSIVSAESREAAAQERLWRIGCQLDGFCVLVQRGLRIPSQPVNVPQVYVRSMVGGRAVDDLLIQPLCSFVVPFTLLQACECSMRLRGGGVELLSLCDVGERLGTPSQSR